MSQDTVPGKPSERLEILEALMILVEKPEINKQDTGKKRILTLFQ